MWHLPLPSHGTEPEVEAAVPEQVPTANAQGVRRRGGHDDDGSAVGGSTTADGAAPEGGVPGGSAGPPRLEGRVVVTGAGSPAGRAVVAGLVAVGADVVALHDSDPDLRIGLVNNPILSPQSAQAAKVMLAVQRKLGSAAAWNFYWTLLSKPGRIDGPGALTAAAALGLPQAEVEEIADSEEVRLALKSQMRMAADLGLYATPSYVLGNSGILGHPGANAMAKMIASIRRCDRLAC